MDKESILKNLTVEEKCSLLVGKNAWQTMNVDRLDIPSLFMADGPHGLRKVIDSTSVSVTTAKAVCYPSLVTLASSFDPKIAFVMGSAIAREFKAQDVNLILGPGINIKRHPFCGRNFEYFSEDPYVTIQMARGFIEGAKSEEIGVCLKHYALNSQEDYRMVSNSIADERAKYEIYYKAFQELVQLKPEMVMCSYNRIDDTYASENYHHLKEVLRDEFGFNGLIVSDWAAVNDRTDALIATLDLEMPGYIYGIHKLIEDYKKKNITDKELDASISRLLDLVEQFRNQETKPVDLEKQHMISSDIAAQSMVLLKNDDNLLPIQEDDKVLLVGDMAKAIRYQGGGSSHINSYKVDTIYDVLKTKHHIDYLRGYDASTDLINSDLLDEIKNLAPNYQKIILVCGLTDRYESEGYDREHLNLPKNQEYIINQLANINQNIIIVLQIGSPVVMPFIHSVKSILNCYLGGEGLGVALEKVLYGEMNPSGRLAETFPKSHDDIPSNPFYKTGNNNVFYQESIYVGYRYFCSTNKEVLFPFGYGLSYSHFEYSNMTVSREDLKTSKQTITVTVDITNNGPFDGKEVVLLFYEPKNPKTPRPKRELIGFEKLEIKNGETVTVRMKVNADSFNYYHIKKKEFVTDDGIYNLQICKNARDILIEKPIEIKMQKEYLQTAWNKLNSYLPQRGLTFTKEDFEQLINRPVRDQHIRYTRPFTFNNNFEDIGETTFGRLVKKQIDKRAIRQSQKQDPEFVRMMEVGLKQMPLRALALLSHGEFKINMAKGVVELVNRKYCKAIKYLLRKD